MPERAAPARNVAEYTVTELSAAIKRTMEDGFGYVRLRGEISGYRGPHASGHVYFALKDERAKIEAVIWKGIFGGLRFKPEEGMEVIAAGKVTTFPGASKYQIVIESLEPAGAGALMALLEERKKKLAAEGLFDEARKKPIPFFPSVIGIVTSPTGAVIRDMLHGFAERFPARVVVWPVRVQGETCAAEVAAAIRGFNALGSGGPIPRPDLIIVARGGGSIEDLWGFNEEIAVRAAAASAIPLISAVGHETDWTLIDLAADARAPTPTKAAEWATPKFSELVSRLGEAGARLRAATLRLGEARRSALKGLARGLPRLADLTAMPRQRFDACAMRLSRALEQYAAASRTRLSLSQVRLSARLLSARIDKAADRLAANDGRMRRAYGDLLQRRRIALARPGGRLHAGLLGHPAARGREGLAALGLRGARGLSVIVERRRRALEARGQLLASLSYRRVLERGYAVVRDAATGAMLRRAEEASAGSSVKIEFADGMATAHIAGSQAGGAAGHETAAASRKKAAQGRLF